MLKVGIIGWVETRSETLAEAIREAMTAGGATIVVLATRLDERDTRLDAKLSRYLYMTPNDKLKKHFLDDSIWVDEGKTSAFKFYLKFRSM